MPRCCCSRILTTSKGVTMTRASVMPAAKPAPMRRTLDSFPSCRQPDPLQPTAPSGSASGSQHAHVARQSRCNLPSAHATVGHTAQARQQCQREEVGCSTSGQA